MFMGWSLKNHLNDPKLWNAADHSQAIMFCIYLLCIVIICSLYSTQESVSQSSTGLWVERREMFLGLFKLYGNSIKIFVYSESKSCIRLLIFVCPIFVFLFVHNWRLMFLEALWTSEVGEHKTHEKKKKRKEMLQVFIFLNCAAKIKSNVVTTIACDIF